MATEAITMYQRRTKCSVQPLRSLFLEPEPLPRLFPEVRPGTYALGPELARGGMGRVVIAEDLIVGRSVAIKELSHADSPLLAARFRREVRLTAKLAHPNIVQVYDAGTWADGTPFFTMPLVRGRTLQHALAYAPDLTARLALLPALEATATAIAHAHKHDIIHRDLKPGNILLSDHGETIVIDWGLAKHLGEPDRLEDDPRLHALGHQQLTAAGQVMGTASYMPIEQALGAPVDARTDVYALGAMLSPGDRPPALSGTVERGAHPAARSGSALSPAGRRCAGGADRDREQSDGARCGRSLRTCRRGRRCTRRSPDEQTGAKPECLAPAIRMNGLLRSCTNRSR